MTEYEDEYEEEEEIFNVNKRDYEISVENMKLWVKFLSANAICADCDSKDPKYIVLDLGTIVCEKCGKLHYQEFDRRVRFIYSRWQHEEIVKLVDEGGNDRLNSFLERNLKYDRPQYSDESEDHFYFLIDKYCFYEFWQDRVKATGFIVAQVEKQKPEHNNLFFTMLSEKEGFGGDQIETPGKQVLCSKRLRQQNYLWKNVHTIHMLNYQTDTLRIDHYDWTNEEIVESKEIKLSEITFERDVEYEWKNGEITTVVFYFYGSNKTNPRKGKVSGQRKQLWRKTQLTLEKDRIDRIKKVKEQLEKERLLRKEEKKKAEEAKELLPKMSVKKVRVNPKRGRKNVRGRKVNTIRPSGNRSGVGAKKVKTMRPGRKVRGGRRAKPRRMPTPNLPKSFANTARKKITKKTNKKTIEELKKEVESEFGDIDFGLDDDDDDYENYEVDVGGDSESVEVHKTSPITSSPSTTTSRPPPQKISRISVQMAGTKISSILQPEQDLSQVHQVKREHPTPIQQQQPPKQEETPRVQVIPNVKPVHPRVQVMPKQPEKVTQPPVKQPLEKRNVGGQQPKPKEPIDHSPQKEQQNVSEAPKRKNPIRRGHRMLTATDKPSNVRKEPSIQKGTNIRNQTGQRGGKIRRGGPNDRKQQPSNPIKKQPQKTTDFVFNITPVELPAKTERIEEEPKPKVIVRKDPIRRGKGNRRMVGTRDRAPPKVNNNSPKKVFPPKVTEEIKSRKKFPPTPTSAKRKQPSDNIFSGDRKRFPATPSSAKRKQPSDDIFGGDRKRFPATPSSAKRKQPSDEIFNDKPKDVAPPSVGEEPKIKISSARQRMRERKKREAEEKIRLEQEAIAKKEEEIMIARKIKEKQEEMERMNKELARQDEEARKRKEEERKRRLEEEKLAALKEAKRREEEKIKRLLDLKKRKEEERRIKEEKKRADQLKVKQKIEAEKAKRLEKIREAKRYREEEKKREELQRRKREEEERKKEFERRRAENERRRKEEQRKREEDEKKRLLELKRVEEERIKKILERRKAREEKKRKARELEEKQKAEWLIKEKLRQEAEVEKWKREEAEKEREIELAKRKKEDEKKRRRDEAIAEKRRKEEEIRRTKEAALKNANLERSKQDEMFDRLKERKRQREERKRKRMQKQQNEPLVAPTLPNIEEDAPSELFDNLSDGEKLQSLLESKKREEEKIKRLIERKKLRMEKRRKQLTEQK